MRKRNKILLWTVGVIVALAVIGALAGKSKKDTTQPPVASTTTAAATTATTPPTTTQGPQYELIVSQSSCQESPSTAMILCSIGVKNRGDTAGVPTVFASYYYNDSGNSYDESDNGQCQASDPIPPGQLGWVYFCHPYNGLQHDLLKAAVTLNENANAWPYVRIASQDDLDWPVS